MPFDDANHPGVAKTDGGGLDPNKVEKKIGADPAIVGEHLETASTTFRHGIDALQVPGGQAAARDQLFQFRQDVNAGEGVATARPTIAQIDGHRYMGLQTTSGEGVTTFVSHKGSWTVNNDGTYTPVPKADGGVVAKPGEAPLAKPLTSPDAPVQPLTALTPPGTDATAPLTRQQRLEFQQQHPLPPDSGLRQLQYNQQTGNWTARNAEGDRVALSFNKDTKSWAPAPVADAPGGSVRVPLATEKPAQFVPPAVPAAVDVVNRPAGAVVERPPGGYTRADVVKAIVDGTGAKAYDPRTGTLTLPDGSTAQVPRNIQEQIRTGQWQSKPDDVNKYFEQVRMGVRPDQPGGVRPDLNVRDGSNTRPLDVAKLGVQPGGQGLDQQQARDLLNAQRMQQLSVDMQNPKMREQMLATLQQLQSGKLDGLGPNALRMQDLLKEMGGDKAAMIKQMLENPHGPMKIGQLDPASQGRFANLVDLMQGKDVRLTGGIADGGISRNSPIDRLQDFLKLHEGGLGRVPGGESGKAFFNDLNLLVRDVNKQLGLEAGKGGLTVADLLGRRFEDGRMAAQLGLLPGQLQDRGLMHAENFAIKLTPGEQITMRMMQLQQELAGKRIDSIIRSDMPMANQIMSKPLDVILAGARNLDSIGMKDAAAMAMNLAVRDLGLRDATAASLAGNIAREFLVSQVKNEGVRAADGTRVDGIKVGEVRVDGKLDVNAAKAQADALASAAAQMGMRVDPAILQGIKDGTIVAPPSALDVGIPLTAAAAQKQQLEEDERRRRKEKEEEEQELRDKEQEMKDAAFAALIAAKKRQEQKEKEEQEKAQEKDKKEAERRTKYVVKEGDTLESIAGKMLRDRRLAALIYEINKEVIPVIVRKGKEVVALRPKMVIWLPTTTDIRAFRGRLATGGAAALDFSESSKNLTAEEELTAKFGDGWTGEKDGAQPAGEALEDLAADAVAAAKKRRENIENLLGPLKGAAAEAGGRASYVVRLGDTLKSVAMKHPSMQDISLWKLLAEVNDITSKTDEKGHPQAALRRGTAIAIPTPEEIAAFKGRQSTDKKPGMYGGAASEIKTKKCAGCGRATISGASICPGCFRSFDEEAKTPPNTIPVSTAGAVASATGDSGAVTVPITSSGGASTSRQITQNPASQPIDRTSVIRPSAAPAAGPSTQVASAPPDVSPLSEAVRISRSGILETTGLKLRLEMKLTGSYWLPVVTYEIFEDVSLRHEYTADGSRKTVRIDLPPQAAAELAENDVTSNWQTYCDKFASTAR